jgi:hypothetical protein
MKVGVSPLTCMILLPAKAIKVLSTRIAPAVLRLAVRRSITMECYGEFVPVVMP